MIVDLLRKRCSMRKFQDKPIPQDIIDYIIEAGRLSPSGGNEQPWMFGIINDKILINKISDAAYNQKWLNSSPLLIVLCTKIIEDEKGARNIQVSRYPEWENDILEMNKELYSKLNSEEHQTKIPGSYMALAALEHGIMSNWVSLFKVDAVSTLLNLQPDCLPSEIIAFGYPDDKLRYRGKKSKEEIVFTNSFEDPWGM